MNKYVIKQHKLSCFLYLLASVCSVVLFTIMFHFKQDGGMIFIGFCVTIYFLLSSILCYSRRIELSGFEATYYSLLSIKSIKSIESIDVSGFSVFNIVTIKGNGSTIINMHFVKNIEEVKQIAEKILELKN